jgi:hypothetical protein
MIWRETRPPQEAYATVSGKGYCSLSSGRSKREEDAVLRHSGNLALDWVQVVLDREKSTMTHRFCH